jgi:hypothetical protein
MNDDLTVGSITSVGSDYGVVTTSGIVPMTMTTASALTIAAHAPVEDIMDKWIMNRVTIDHKVQEQELMKLKEVAPDYANEIKENLAKNAARDMIKKITFTKKHDKDADVHHFIGRVWCFTEQELKDFIEEVRNV